MVKVMNRIGDRLLQRFVPKTEAKAGAYYACYCEDFVNTWVYKYCDGNGCTSCVYHSNVNCLV
ncbi:hypothetical protein GCM10009765_09780 [Fodinicola feengrottensis]|uniref:Uncharacterized protein n=1 Tax=Fodinicola feengrottensis TaxID=435914 RepID=A0ABN2FZ13_9ACTN